MPRIKPIRSVNPLLLGMTKRSYSLISHDIRRDSFPQGKLDKGLPTFPVGEGGPLAVDDGRLLFRL